MKTFLTIFLISSICQGNAYAQTKKDYQTALTLCKEERDKIQEELTRIEDLYWGKQVEKGAYKEDLEIQIARFKYDNANLEKENLELKAQLEALQNTSEHLLKRAGEADSSQNFDEAHGLYNKIVELHPSSPEAAYVSENNKSYEKSTDFKKPVPYDSGKDYIRGPRGGCYYLSASGGKVYVDRSYCNNVEVETPKSSSSYSSPSSSGGTTHVKGHYRTSKSGKRTYVKPHTRRN